VGAEVESLVGQAEKFMQSERLVAPLFDTRGLGRGLAKAVPECAGQEEHRAYRVDARASVPTADG
jgi:hypothetical protein